MSTATVKTAAIAVISNMRSLADERQEPMELLTASVDGVTKVLERAGVSLRNEDGYRPCVQSERRF